MVVLSGDSERTGTRSGDAASARSGNTARDRAGDAARDRAGERAGWWGTDTALNDDQEARRRLIAAAIRCLVRHRGARFPIDEVAATAGVARSTVYRYFRSRDDLVLSVLLSRTDDGLARMVEALPHPADAAASITDLVQRGLDLIREDPVNAALYAEENRSALVTAALTSEPFLEAVLRHAGPLIDQWKADGQLHADLSAREVLVWIHSVTTLLLGPPWSRYDRAEMRGVIERFLVRALVLAPAPEGLDGLASPAAEAPVH